MGVILKIENISKQYRLGLVGTGTISHDLNRFWARIRGKEDPYLKVGAINKRDTKAKDDYVWALQDINFEVQKGEVLGIIGKNGAGKSTLLKILSRVTSPTTGTIKTRGRIASLLEVGTGFHPELTGKENIFLNGAILGMTKAEITEKIDEIVEFSGCELYIDTPVKRYSSGMRVRLAFSVAAHLEPDILVVDEVLAVGDAEFQKKAIGKMKDISQTDGRTVLFVSHDMNAISLLTDRVVILKNGKTNFIGDTDVAINKYLKGGDDEINYTYTGVVDNPKIISASVNTSLPGNIHEFGKHMNVSFKVNIPYKVKNLALAFQIIDEFQIPITHNWQIDVEGEVERTKGIYSFTCNFKKMRLYMGNYALRIYLSNSKTKERYDFIETTCNFKVEMMKTNRTAYNWQKGACKYIEDSMWKTEKGL